MDIAVTVPRERWLEWICEGDLPGEDPIFESHFFIAPGTLPDIHRGDRVYIVAHGKLRGFAPLVRVEPRCLLRRDRACLLRRGGAVAVTLPWPEAGFRGWKYRWWNREDEIPFPDWQTP